jgi:hypothetical protein
MIAPERGTKVTAYFEVEGGKTKSLQKIASVHGAKG